MAAEDLRRLSNNYKKRDVCVMVSQPLTGTQINGDGATIATLPDKSMLIGMLLYTSVVSGDVDTVDVNYNGSEVGSEISAEVEGVTPETITVANAYSATGGDIVIKDGAQAVTSVYRGRLIILYIELDKWTGDFTEIPTQ